MSCLKSEVTFHFPNILLLLLDGGGFRVSGLVTSLHHAQMTYHRSRFLGIPEMQCDVRGILRNIGTPRGADPKHVFLILGHQHISRVIN